MKMDVLRFIAAALDEAKRNLRDYEDRSKGWMSSRNGLNRDKETLTICVMALAKAIKGGES